MSNLKQILLVSFVINLFACSGGASNNNSQLPEPNNPSAPPTVEKIVIIGAGAAGIAAASELQSPNKEVVILEARDRIGGRVWSDRRKDNRSVDLGGAWIHGIEGNPIHSLAQQQGLSLSVTDYDNLRIFDEDGTADPLTDAQLANINAAMQRTAEDMRGNPSEVTIQDVADKVLLDYPNISRKQLDFVIALNIENEYAVDSDKLSLLAADEGEVFSGDDVMFVNGYDQIFTDLIVDLDIRLNHVVTAIDYSSSQIVVSIEGGEDFIADKVLITVPVGVLNKNVIAFTPELPDSKRAAISALDMGVFNRVYLHFPEVFWDQSVHAIGHMSEVKGKWSMFVNLERQYGDSALVAISTAEYGTQVEAFSDEHIQEEVMQILKTIYGSDIPFPDDVRITRWNSDPFAYGAYSYLKIGSTGEVRDTLAQSIDAKLFFAGEATHTEYPSTVHGAYLSGIREAQKMQ